MDGNFAAEHMKMRNPEDDVHLADGDGFFVESTDYQKHLATVKHTYKVSQLSY